MNSLYFLHPTFWPFLLALGVPLWLHLRRRRFARTQVLPTFALLQTALGRQAPVLRWRQILLLLLRLLTLLFLLLGFMRPTIPAVLGRSNGRGRAVVLLLDNSLSTGASSGGLSALERAKGRVMALLDDLRQGDTASVIFCGTAPRPVLSKLSADFGTLRQAVRSAAPGFERGNPPAAIALAESELSESDKPRRELITASDFQKTEWTLDAFQSVPADVKLVFLAASDTPPDNAAITNLRLPALLPVPGEPAPVTAEVWNGSQTARRLTVSLTVSRDDGAAADVPQIAPQSVTVPPFGSANVVFSAAFPDAARYRITARLPADALPAANSRYVIADLQNRLNVLLLTDSAFGNRDGTAYLRQALNPEPDTPGGFRVIARSPGNLTEGDLRSNDVVICSEIEAFPPKPMDWLVRYARNGGAAVYFLANPQAIPQVAEIAKRAAAGEKTPFSPETYLDIRGQEPGFIGLNPPRSGSPLLRLFADPAVADLTKIRFTRYALTAPMDADSEVLLTFTNGTPALVRRDFGRGAFLFCNFSASPLAGDLAKQTLFPPLVHELIQGMAAKNAGRSEWICGAGRAAAAGFSRPGFYAFSENGGVSETVAVNAPPEEMDLRELDLRQIAAGREPGSAHIAGTGGAGLDGLRRDAALWPYCIALALGFLLLEGWLANRRK